ncbi:hypothetical protein AQUCO_00500063v1 [Aquilegia coerulea]|uniref:Cytochrome P450 n=1 Tax=Aquilegia coerulea TaxID=218851 RepID=A0A2G5EQ58_AQUCA|nr:hypothetical protein AQUCO_00500063v1 [Aquilegia coerulea]
MISKALYEYTTIPVLILSVTLIFFTLYEYGIKKWRKEKVPLPPGPRGLPIVGNLPFLDRNLHTYFAKLAETYGPIFKLQLGSRLCVVWNSASIVKEAQEHDIIFASRDVLAVAIPATYGGTDMIWSPYGEHWRMLRKTCVRELLNNTRLDALYGLRRKEVQDMVKDIYSKNGNSINIGEYILVTMFRLITSMLWGGTELEMENKDSLISEFVKVIHEISEVHGQPNVSDFFPVLARFDLQGLGSKSKKFSLWLDRLLEIVINQREKSSNSNIKQDDFLQVLLKLKDQQDNKTTFSRTDLKTLLEDMMLAATKTSSTAIEWAMTELIKHPEIMLKVQDEIKEVVGMSNMVEESHLLKLNYLNAVVKEAMRLHPVIPLLMRSPSASVILGGYLVPKGTKILVNVWAIQRDPQYWDDPLMFKPDRFLNSENGYDNKGTNFSYLPFGTGRRVCVGIPMAEKMVPYLLASLLHSFDWKLPDAMELDLSETFGLELAKRIPLLVIPTPRLSGALYTF